MKSKIIPLITAIFALVSCDFGSTTQPPHIHSYSSTGIEWTWTSNSVGYEVVANAKCLDCQETATEEAYVDLVSSTSSCLETGERVYKATASFGGTEYSDTKTDSVAPLNHNVSNEWSHDETEHYHVCERCKEHLNVELHTFSGWETTEQPDYGKKGKETNTCSVCNYVVERDIDALVPTVNEVQTLINKVVNSPFPYSYQFIDDALYLYGYLTATDKNNITNYDNVVELKDTYESTYDIISSVENREIRKRDADGLNYSGTWEGEISTKTDNTHGLVNVLNIETVGTGWGEQHFNGISFTEDVVNIAPYKKIEFAIYNPASSVSEIYLFTNGWYFVPNQVTHKLSPGWNNLSFDVKDGSYNSNDGLHDFDLNEFTILLTNNQVNNGWMISNFYGLKDSAKEIQRIINLIEALPEANLITAEDKTAIEEARKSYDALSEYAQSLVTNSEKLTAAEDALTVFFADEVIDLIDVLPEEIESDIFLTFNKLNTIETRYGKLSSEAKLKVTNYNKYEDLKALFDAKYQVIYNPQTYNGVVVEGVQHGTYSLSNYADENYGPMVKFDANVSIGFSQLYAYNFPNITFGPNDILNFKIYSSFEAVNNTSQTFWTGNYATANKINLNAKDWTSISGTGASFNSDNSYATGLNSSGTSFVNIQRWAEDSVLPNPYSGYYYLSAIILEIVK